MSKDEIGMVLIVAAIIAIFVLVVFAILSSTSDSIEDKGQSRTTTGESSGIKYTIIYIEGMPCVWIEHIKGEGGVAGLSCDWSKRQ